MPVRIYDISKKLGLENKEVLAKAKELGIAGARVASSSLDKITAEYLEQQLVIAHPEKAQAAATATAATAVVSNDAITIVRAPEPPIEEEPESSTVTASTAVSPEPATIQPPAEPTPADLAAANGGPAAPPPEKIAPPPPPPEPAGPRVGDKIGFIQLPTKPGPKPPDKSAPVRPPARPGGDSRGGTE